MPTLGVRGITPASCRSVRGSCAKGDADADDLACSHRGRPGAATANAQDSMMQKLMYRPTKEGDDIWAVQYHATELPRQTAMVTVQTAPAAPVPEAAPRSPRPPRWSLGNAGQAGVPPEVVGAARAARASATGSWRGSATNRTTAAASARRAVTFRRFTCSLSMNAPKVLTTNIRLASATRWGSGTGAPSRGKPAAETTDQDGRARRPPSRGRAARRPPRPPALFR